MSRPPTSIIQTNYLNSTNSLKSAQNLIKQKILNQQGLLNNYLAYQRKTYPIRAQIFTKIINQLSYLQQKISLITDKNQLVLLEARAAKIYWSAFATLANQNNRWQRIHPHGPDQLNKMLNIGYTMLLNIIRQATANYNLNPKIGFFHASEQNKEALLYDFMELFRQTLIDQALLPLFSRNKKQNNISIKNVTKVITKQIHRPFVYQGDWLIGKEIINIEICNYKNTMLKMDVWQPYKHNWSHAKKKKPRQSRG